MQIVNLAAYKFVPLTDLKQRRQRLHRLCQRTGLRGTILLANEGINLFVAGSDQAAEKLLADLAEDTEIGTLEVKRSTSQYQPFNRMLVKIKREIIALGAEGIDPAHRPAPRITPRELKEWLDEGRNVTLLDTRNDYEIKLGSFVGARSAGISHFRDFPAAARSFPEQWRKQPLVMFCTGGIRCEKAGPLLEELGFEQVFQLDGGILKYFEEVGQDHYRGDCFVFDQRVAVDAALRETEAAQCYACQAILTADEQKSPLYQPGQSCPSCYREPEEEAADRLRLRQRQLALQCSPLPGSVPYENRRPLFVAARYDGYPVITWLTDVAKGSSLPQWREQIALGRVLIEGRPVQESDRVIAGQRCEHLLPEVVEPPVNPAIDFLYEDQALVIVHKPAPLPMHPCGRFNKNTLAGLLAPLYRPEKLRNAHRLDANTSGVVAFTRTQRMAQRLQPQFERGEVRKVYLALVQGHPTEETFVCDEPISVHNIEAGIRVPAADGLPARTLVRVLERRPAGQTLLEVSPLTGRTNQIRIHLWSRGLPIAGDPAYLADHRLGTQQTLAPDAPPMCLHAQRLAFRHPASGEALEFTAPDPAWL
jgi:UPF0176 protein